MDDQCDILVLMANTTQLKQFVDKMKDVQFSLFVDEADALMNTIKTKKDYNVNHCMKLIYEQSKIVFLISATNYAILFEHSISTSHIFYINKHKNYKGINDIEFNILQDSDKNLHGTLFEKSPNLPYVVTNLTHRAVYDNHPIVLLIKFTHLVSDQDEFIRTIFTYDDWKHEWAAISYNGTGINMYHHTFNGDINIKNTKGVDLGNCIYSFKNIDIQDTLTYLRENGGQSRFPRIVIISGHLASRCINFMDTTYNWHITDEYIDPSKTMNCTDLIQSLRICGIHNMSTPLNVWTTESVIKNIVYTNINIGEFIHQYVNSVQKKENEDVCCKKMLTRVKIHKDKLGDKPVSKVRAPYTTVSNEKHDNMDEILGVEKNTSDSEPDSDIIKEGLKKVKIAYETKNGLVHKIIKAFVNNDFEGMTQTKLESHCCVKISNIKHYMEWASHGRYKIIYKKNVNGQDIYNLDSEIVKHLNLIK
jgi:hypothetical protein